MSTGGIVKMFRGFLAFACMAMISNLIIAPTAYFNRTITLEALLVLPVLMHIMAVIRLRMLIRQYSDVLPLMKSWAFLCCITSVSAGIWIGGMSVSLGFNTSIESWNACLWTGFSLNTLAFVVALIIFGKYKTAVYSSNYANMEALDSGDEEMPAVSPRTATVPAPLFTSAPSGAAPVYIMTHPGNQMMTYNPNAPIYVATNPNTMTSPQFMYTTAPQASTPVIYYTNPQ